MRSTRSLAKRSPLVQPPPPRAPDPETVTVEIATATLRALVADVQTAAVALADNGAARPILDAQTALLRAFGLEPIP